MKNENVRSLMTHALKIYEKNSFEDSFGIPRSCYTTDQFLNFFEKKFLKEKDSPFRSMEDFYDKACISIDIINIIEGGFYNTIPQIIVFHESNNPNFIASKMHCFITMLGYLHELGLKDFKSYINKHCKRPNDIG